MKPCLRERKPSLKYKFYDDYESDESEPACDSDKSDDDINYCHDCDLVFEDRQRLHKHLLKHIKQPKVQLHKLGIATERAPIRITLKGCGSGDFEIVQSPTSEREFSSPLQQIAGKSSESTLRGNRVGKTDDDYEQKYIIPKSDPVAGCATSGQLQQQHQQPVFQLPVGKTEPEDEEEGNIEEQEEEEEENAMNVSFSPTYSASEMMHNEDNSQESRVSSNKPTASDGGYDSSAPAAEPTPPPEPSPTPDHLMPKIRIKPSGLLMAPERESPQGLTITEITEGDEAAVVHDQDPFASVDSWGVANTGATHPEDPLRLPDTIETDGNIISNLFTNNTDRAKDLGLTSSDSEFIPLDGLGNSDNNRSGNSNNNAVAVYNPSNANASTQNQLLPASVSNALVGLPMQQLAQQVSRLQPQQGVAGQQMHQQNVLINIQQFPQAPQQQPQQAHMQPQQQQVQPYGMYHHQYPGYQQSYGHPPAPGAYGQPYAQPNLYYAAPPPGYPVAQPAQHMPTQQPLPQQQPAQAYIVQTAPQQQPQQQQPIVLGTVSPITPAQGQQIQQYGSQQQQGQQVGYVGQQQQGQAQGQQPQYNQGTYPQQQQQPNQSQQQPQQPQQVSANNRMLAPRAPGQATAPRMGGPRGPPMVGSRAPYSPRGGAAGATRQIMSRGGGGRGAPAAMGGMRGRARAPGGQNLGAQNGLRQPMQQGNSPVKRTPEQMAALQAKRRRMEQQAQGTTASVKVEQDDDDDDCELVGVLKPEGAKLPKIQSVQGAVSDPETNTGGVMHLSDSITLSIRQPPPKPPSPKAKSDANKVANVLASRGITVTAAPKENHRQQAEPVPISLNNSLCLVPNKKKDEYTPTVDLTDDVRVPPPKPMPSNGCTTATGGATTAPPTQPFKCDQCPARYGTNVALVKHRQLTHKTCNQMDYGVPLIDLRQAGIMTKLTNFGIYNYIPLPAANVSGMFALPVISMNAVKNNVNLSALGNSMLTLGPIRKIQKAGASPGGPQQSPTRGRPPSNPSTPTKQQQQQP